MGLSKGVGGGGRGGRRWELPWPSGDGPVVLGEERARGMELISRSVAKGRVFVMRAEGVLEWRGRGAVSSFWEVFAAASSQAARAAGSMGQEGGGGTLSSVIILEFPMSNC